MLCGALASNITGGVVTVVLSLAKNWKMQFTNVWELWETTRDIDNPLYTWTELYQSTRGTGHDNDVMGSKRLLLLYNPPNGYTNENRTPTTLRDQTTTPALERALVTIAHQDNVLQPLNKMSFTSSLQPHHMVESSVGPAPQAANISIGYGETPCFNPEEEDIEDYVEEFKTWLTASKVLKGDWTKALVRRLPLDGREFIKCRNDGRARSRGNELKKMRRPQSTENTGKYLMNLITAHATAGEFSPFDSNKEALWALAPKDCLLLAASWSTTRNPEEADFLQAAKFLDEADKWNKGRKEAGTTTSLETTMRTAEEWEQKRGQNPRTETPTEKARRFMLPDGTPRCFTCYQTGHKHWDCPKRRPRGEYNFTSNPVVEVSNSVESVPRVFSEVTCDTNHIIFKMQIKFNTLSTLFAFLVIMGTTKATSCKGGGGNEYCDTRKRKKELVKKISPKTSKSSFETESNCDDETGNQQAVPSGPSGETTDHRPIPLEQSSKEAWDEWIEAFIWYEKAVQLEKKPQEVQVAIFMASIGQLAQKIYKTFKLNEGEENKLQEIKVEDPYFSKIFTDLEISEMGLTLMSRRSLGRRIENHYETQVAKIKSKLKEASYVCTEIDIWSSKKRSFIGVTAHWVTNDLRRVSVALACQRFKGVHSYNQLSDIIQEINDHFDLNTNKIVASVTDNGSNFVKAFKMFCVKLTNINIVDEAMPDSQPTEAFSESDVEDDESSNLEDPEHLLPAHLRCCAHTLSLCATTDANKLLSEQDTPLSQMHAAIMKKCNALWKAAGRPKSTEIMQNVLGHTLSLPASKWWEGVNTGRREFNS
ncbi:hypothetical protein LAZ67_21000804 [Cordylochernes scorpioides]|uniref:CCHC-type domain-containing protein n=1 Tax=Cordylochernes scorpioides TaxID=51811 RepID=A0ABY6LQG0_9ARAC|nr:hypothetical protein LAZ67_21000804 [Cordylochernes scorpioides]